jgi:hypothetical protein
MGTLAFGFALAAFLRWITRSRFARVLGVLHQFRRVRAATLFLTKVEPLLHLLWSKEISVVDIPDLFEAKAYCQKNFDTFPAAVTRCVNAEPFRVGVSSIMYDHLHRMILENTTIDEL